MRLLLFAVMLADGAPPALSTDVGVSAGGGQARSHGRIDLGDDSPPKAGRGRHGVE